MSTKELTGWKIFNDRGQVAVARPIFSQRLGRYIMVWGGWYDTIAKAKERYPNAQIVDTEKEASNELSH